MLLVLMACVPEPTWHAEVEARLEAGGYAFSEVEGEHVAVNARQGFAARFDGDGWRVSSPEGSWEIGLGVARWGRGVELAPPGAPAYRDGPCTAAVDPLGACVRRLEGVRPGLTEWWENDADGLEHGLVLDEPAGEGDLVVELEVSGGSVAAEGDAARFGLPDGRSLRYDGLVVTDATGRRLDARMEPASGGLRIVVDVETARWPVEIDPTVSTGWWAMYPTQSSSYWYFAYDLDFAGDVNGDGYDDLIVGMRSYLGYGAAFVYHGSASGPSATASTGIAGTQYNAEFGYAVAGAGDVNGDGWDDVIVGAKYGSDGVSEEGKVYVFHGSATGVGTSASWSEAGGASTGYFGTAVAGAGDVNGDGYDDVIVGAYGVDNGSTDEGRAYVYTGSATGLGAAATWYDESDQASAYFGHAVAGIGDVNGDGWDDVAVGAYAYDDGQTDEGEVFVYLGSATGPSLAPDWSFDGDQTSALAGWALGGAGDVNDDGYDDLVVGAPYYDVGSTDDGRAWIFHGSASGLATSAAATLEIDDAAARFGYDVDGAGDVDGDGWDDVVIGAMHAGYDGTTYPGSTSIFHGSASGVATTATTSFSGGDYTGRRVAGGGDADGDGYDDVLTANYDPYATVWLLAGGPDGATWTTPWDTRLEESGTTMGYDVAAAGDVNDDGYDDVVAGNYSSSGSVYVWHGSADGLDPDAATTLSGSSNAHFGRSVDGAGDVDGDGFDDIVVGSPQGGTSYEGIARVFYGASSGVASSGYSTVESNQASAYLGYGASGIGDVDGDSYADVAVGAYAWDDGQTNEGAVFVYEGSASGLDTTPVAILTSDLDSAYFGYSAEGAGDVDGDGWDDLIVGAYNAEDTVGGEGGAWVYLGDAAGLSTSASWTFFPGQRSASCGGGVAGIGDVDDDGYDEVAVGCFYYDDGETDEGAVLVFHGSTAGPDTAATWSFDSDQADVRFGLTVDRLGDVDGDGFDDLALGAPYYDSTYANQGVVWFFLGGESGLSTSPDTTFEASYFGSYFGRVAAGAGDVDGDGRDELVTSEYTRGLAYVYSFDDADGDGDYAWTDCDDADPTAYTGATESCDGVDNDCDGATDEDVPTWYLDADGDGYGDPASATANCTQPSGYVSTGDDCDDTDATTNPAGTETCDGADDDCDGSVDEAGATGETTFYADADGDGHGVPTDTFDACNLPSGYAADDDDCDDDDAGAYPGAAETCDGADDDCDGVTDEDDAVDASAWYLDADADGYGDAALATTACAAPSGSVADATDCDDADAAVHPGAAETCDGADDDCDGTVDDGVTTTWYLDTDGDGYGDASATTAACSQPSGFSATDGDCDDGDAASFPGASESCDDADDDCDGAIDEGLATSTWYLDADGDGYGDASSASVDCAQPSGSVPDATDCDDDDAGVNPGAQETWYDGDDADCDGRDDYDQDGDGYVSDAYAGGDDCDDTDEDVHPGAADLWYDGVDADCDRASDYDRDGDGQDAESWGGEDCDDEDAEVYAGAPDDPYDGQVTDCGSTWEYDADRDGWLREDDCDDTDDAVHPGAEERWYDGVDQDCDGNDDDADGDGVGADADCDDADASLWDDCEEGGGKGGCGCGGSDPAGWVGLVVAAVIAGRRRLG